MAHSKLDEHNIRDANLQDVVPGEQLTAGPFTLEMIHMTHSIPDACAVAVGTDLGTVLLTGDYKFDQTPVDGQPADIARLAELGSDGVLLLCGDSTNADRAGFSPSERDVGPHLEEVFARAEGRIVVTSFASNIHRVQQCVDAAAALGRKVALVGRSMRKNVNIGRSLGHIEDPRGPADPAARGRGLARPQGRRDLDGLSGRAAVGAATDGVRRHRQITLHRGDTVVFRRRRSLATSARSTRRSTGCSVSAAR